MTRFQTPQDERPWWASVEHLRDRADDTSGAAVMAAGRVLTPATEARPDAARAVTPRPRRHVATAPAQRTRGQRPDWFAEEANRAGRRQSPRPEANAPARPRATLVDVSPDHLAGRRAQQVRRAPGERPTVTITGRPDGALPPQPREIAPVRGARAREHASSLVSSPDRLMLWAVALGILMILASLGTAGAGA